MRAAHILVVAGLFFAVSAQAGAKDLLPIEHGTYVREGVDAADPPFAAIFEYDGATISGPHSSQCTSTVTSHEDEKYLLSTTCNALGDGTPAAPYTEEERVVVRSATRVKFAHGHDVEAYRLVTPS
jgi:hypothetical protein